MKKGAVWVVVVLLLCAGCSVSRRGSSPVASSGGREESLAPRLRVEAPLFLPVDSYQVHPDAAYGKRRFFLVWQDGYHGVGAGGSTIKGLFFSPVSGAPEGALVEVSGKEEGVRTAPAVAFCGDRFLVVWAAMGKHGDYDLRGAFVYADGTVGEVFDVASSPGAQAFPDVCGDGKDGFYVVWQDHGGTERFHVRVAHVGADGKVVPQRGKVVIENAERPCVTRIGDGIFVGVGCMGALVSSNLSSVRLMRKLWRAASPTPPVAVTAWGRAYEFFCVSPRPDPWGWKGCGSIVGVSVDGEGNSPEYGLTRHDWYHAAAYRADRKAVNVVDTARWKNENGWPMGMPGGFKGSHTGTWPDGNVAAVFDGTSMIVVWTRARLLSRFLLGTRDLYLKRMLRGWAYVDEPALRLTDDASDEAFPSLASDGAGHSLLAYVRMTARGPRICYRWIRQEPDRTPPRLKGIIRNSPRRMTLVFDEPLDAASVKDGVISIRGSRVVSVRFMTEGWALRRRIVVETSPQHPYHRYVLEVRGVRDLYGNAVDHLVYPYTCKPGTAFDGPFIERWCVVAPFPASDGEFVSPSAHPSPGEKVVLPSTEDLRRSIEKAYALRVKKIAAAAVESRLDDLRRNVPTWREVAAVRGCLLKLSRSYGRKELSCAYAGVYIYSDVPRRVLVRVDSNDGSRAWLNGRMLYDDIKPGVSRGIHDYTSEAEAVLEAGWNYLLVRVDNEFGHWLLTAQVTDLARRSIPFLTYSVSRPGVRGKE